MASVVEDSEEEDSVVEVVSAALVVEVSVEEDVSGAVVVEGSVEEASGVEVV